MWGLLRAARDTCRCYTRTSRAGRPLEHDEVVTSVIVAAPETHTPDREASLEPDTDVDEGAAAEDDDVYGIEKLRGKKPRFLDGASSVVAGDCVHLRNLSDDYYNGLSAFVHSETAAAANCCRVQLALPPGNIVDVRFENILLADQDSASVKFTRALMQGAPAEAELEAAIALKREFRMTHAQKSAFDAIQRIFDAAEAAKPKISSKVDYSYQTSSMGFQMEKLFDFTDLVDAQYLIELAKAGGTLPRWQEVPDAAKISRCNLWRLRAITLNRNLPVLIWSYCWFGKLHPDPYGEQLRRTLWIMETMVADAKQQGGPHCTIGVLIDFCSYPQWPRTAEEQNRFDRGLKQELSKWYAHPHVPVLALDVLASPARGHTNRRPYDERGWCFTEKSLATLAKKSSAFWTLRDRKSVV